MIKIYNLLVMTLLVVGHFSDGSIWPEVEPIEKEYRIDSPKHAKVDLDIIGSQEDVYYRLMCRTGDYNDTKIFNFSGLLHCALFDKNMKSGTLFRTTDYSVEWESRGRFLTHHLIGGCGSTEEWGKVRTFNLRNMKIGLYISNLIISKDGNITAYDLTVKVSRSNSKSSLSESIKEPKMPDWFYSNQCDY